MKATTDDTGPRAVHIPLSKQRAEAVRRHLVQIGVNPQRLFAEGYGPDKPLVSGNSEEARTKNRRMEFVVEQD
jgi:OmpA-OmpF porin, OOP family